MEDNKNTIKCANCGNEIDKVFIDSQERFCPICGRNAYIKHCSGGKCVISFPSKNLKL